MKFRPLHDRVVVERIDPDAKSAGGIIIPDTAQEKPSQGEIIAVGPGGRDESVLFEQVAAIRGETMRHELATFLHDQHPRTSDPPTETREVPEPDSLGG